MPQGLPFNLMDYIELVDWTGRRFVMINGVLFVDNLPPILDRIGIDPQSWIALTTVFEKNTNTFLGAEAHIESAALQLGYKRTPNRQRCKLLLG